MSDFVVSHDQGVLTLQFNSPQTLNAMTPTMVEACTHELEEAVGRDDVRVVVITGSEGGMIGPMVAEAAVFAAAVSPS